VAASLNCAFWAAWVGLNSYFRTIEILGPLLFWSLPIIVSALIWIPLAVRAPRGVQIQYRVAGALAGVSATTLGVPMSIATGVLMAFGAFPPVTFLCIPLEILMVSLGFAGMRALCRAALGWFSRSAV
jgi:hypothetical protein